MACSATDAPVKPGVLWIGDAVAGAVVLVDEVGAGGDGDDAPQPRQPGQVLGAEVHQRGDQDLGVRVGDQRIDQ
jgi:hypothetical protein